MDMNDLLQLEIEFSTSNAFEVNGARAAEAIASFYKNPGSFAPDTTWAEDYFTPLPKPVINANANLTQKTKHELYLEFCDCTKFGLFARYNGQTAEADAYFQRASECADAMQDDFYENEFTFWNGLSGTELGDKLILEACYYLS